MSSMGPVLNLKNSIIYSINRLVKTLQTTCSTTFGSSACQRSFSWHVQLTERPKRILKKVKNQISNTFKIEPL